MQHLLIWLLEHGLNPYGGFRNVGTPIAGWFIMENPILKWMIWGYAYFRKPPYVYRSIVLYFVLYIFVKVRTSYGDHRNQLPAISSVQVACILAKSSSSAQAELVPPANLGSTRQLKNRRWARPY